MFTRPHCLPLLTLALCGLLMPAMAVAKSTTQTTVAVEGQPIQGRQVTLVVHVTGKHLVYGGRGTVFGGYVGVYAQNTNLYREMITVLSTPVTKSVSCGVLDPVSGCYDLYFGENTTIRLPYLVPKGISTLTFTANFEGDNESHGSGATPLTVRTINPAAINAVVNMLLDD